MVGLYPAMGADCFSLFGLKVLPEPTKADERKVKAVSFFGAPDKPCGGLCRC